MDPNAEVMELMVSDAKSLKPYGTCSVPVNTKVNELRHIIHNRLKSVPSPERLSLRLSAKGSSLKDSDTLNQLSVAQGDTIYLRDLGPQIGWRTVFLAEYAGPLFVYLLFYFFPDYCYFLNPGQGAKQSQKAITVHIAAICYTFHYTKRLLETIFVHRFSHATMPLRNLFKNCTYYWGFTAHVSYHINHPNYSEPSIVQVWIFLAMFMFCELGNFSIHVALRNLRPPGTTQRNIPMPVGNLFTQLFRYVSCPNYTYEIGAWLSFALMTQCMSAFFFALAGAVQMSIWALAKHRNYRKEFTNYPKTRRAIFPFIL